MHSEGLTPANQELPKGPKNGRPTQDAPNFPMEGSVMSDTVAPETVVSDFEQGTLEHVDPNTLHVMANVRDEAVITVEFQASIKEHGVLIPIMATRDFAGRLCVRAGQRRTVAAQIAGLATVPVYVRNLTEGDHNAETIQRVAEQIVENDQRRALTDVQRARGIQEMLDAGASVTKVAKKLSVHKDTIKAAATATKSEAAMKVLAEGQLSLEEAAALTEFEDLPGAVDRLIQAAGTHYFDHTVAQLRQRKADAEAQEKAAQTWIERGFTWMQERPQRFDLMCVPLSRLLTAEGEQADDDAVTNPAHWAVLLYESSGYVDTESGEAVDEDAVDWDTEDDAEATPAEGLRHASTVKEATVFEPEYFCLDYRAVGLSLDSYFARNAGEVEGEDDDAVDLDEDARAAAREAARQKAEAEKAEADKRERRKVLALNKLGEAAMGVRRDFVRKLLTRKTAPKGAAIFVTDCLARDSYMLTNHNANEVTANLLGLGSEQPVNAIGSNLAPNADARAQVLTLALVLGALEARTTKDAWRSAGPVSWSRTVTCGDYLRFLAGNGYTLSTVEEVMTNAKTADEAYDLYLAETAATAAATAAANAANIAEPDAEQ